MSEPFVLWVLEHGLKLLLALIALIAFLLGLKSSISNLKKADTAQSERIKVVEANIVSLNDKVGSRHTDVMNELQKVKEGMNDFRSDLRNAKTEQEIHGKYTSDTLKSIDTQMGKLVKRGFDTTDG